MDPNIHYTCTRTRLPRVATENLRNISPFYCLAGIRQSDGLLVRSRSIAKGSDPRFPSNDKVAECCFPENLADVVNCVVEELMERTKRRVPFDAQWATIDANRGVVRRSKYVEDRDLRGWPGEFEPAAAAPLGSEHPALGELPKDFLEISDGHLGRGGDFGCRSGLPCRSLSQKNASPKRILASLSHHQVGPSEAARHRLWSSGVTIV